MIIADIVSYLEQIAPPAYQESYDNARLIVGNKKAIVTGVLICLDAIEAVVDEAIELGCNMIVAHHPIVFGGIKSFTGSNYVERVVIKAIKHDIAIYAAHTNLDNIFKNGVNAKIAEKLGLENTRILAPKRQLLEKLQVFVPNQAMEQVSEALFAAGAGNIGNYSDCSFVSNGIGSFRPNQEANPTIGKAGELELQSEQKIEVIYPAYLQSKIVRAMQAAHPYEEVAYDIIALQNSLQTVGSGLVGTLSEPMEARAFLKKVKEQMQTDCVKHTALIDKPIERVAICGGAGSFLLRHAIAAQADVFITADYKYHEFFDADNALIIADIGHYESEQFTIELFYELLTQKFINFAIHCTKVNTNPVNYI